MNQARALRELQAAPHPQPFELDTCEYGCLRIEYHRGIHAYGLYVGDKCVELAWAEDRKRSPQFDNHADALRWWLKQEFRDGSG